MEVKKSKSFKDYYEDPEFKKKHQLYMSQKIPCKQCGQIVMRGGMTKHKKSNKCHEKVNTEEVYNNNQMSQMQQKIDKLLLIVQQLNGMELEK